MYYPSPSEVADPRAYGRNVREVMASALDLPVVDQRLEDGKEAAASRDTINIVVENEDEDLEDDTYVDVFVDQNSSIRRDRNKLNAKELGYNYVDFTGNLGLVS